MLGTALVVFREVVEAALVIGIACAATRGVPARGLWVTAGICAGVVGAGVVALFAGALAEAYSGTGQELFNACVLLAAVLMLGWHNVWMARHGREMAAEMNAVGRSVSSGARPLHVLGVVVALAVLREGAEIVLFLYGMSAGGSSVYDIAGGGGLGFAGGLALGLALYFGLLTIPMRHFFAVTSWMILLLAAGMASQAARYLIQAGLIPPLGARLWDSSALIAPDSLLGEVLHTLVGYDARPAGMQLLFYLTTLAIIGATMRILGRSAKPVAVNIAAAALLISLAGGLAPDRAYAGPADKIYRPAVEYGETEIEQRGGYIKDKSPAVNTAQAYVVDLGYGFTPWWFSELVGEIEKLPGDSAEFEALEWENVFQLSEPGQYFMDFGLFAEYALPLESGKPQELVLGPMLQKELGRAVTNLNVLAARQFGSNAESEIEVKYRLQSRLRSGGALDAGLQAFGEKDAHLLGPAVFGLTRLDARHKLKYDAALLRGLTADAEDWRLRWQVEYEF